MLEIIVEGGFFDIVSALEGNRTLITPQSLMGQRLCVAELSPGADQRIAVGDGATLEAYQYPNPGWSWSFEFHPKSGNTFHIPVSTLAGMKFTS
jgi:hypothetical protein